jgi:hypothetical protein
MDRQKSGEIVITGLHLPDLRNWTCFECEYREVVTEIQTGLFFTCKLINSKGISGIGITGSALLLIVITTLTEFFVDN